MGTDDRIKEILLSLGIPSQDCVSIFKTKNGSTELVMDFEVLWSLGFSNNNKIKFQNLNSVAKYHYNVRINLDIHSNEEIIKGIQDSLKEIKSQINLLRINDNSRDLPVGISVKDPNEDSYYDIKLS